MSEVKYYRFLRDCAEMHGRDYITPEDIDECYLKGASFEEMAEEYLSILGRYSFEHNGFVIEQSNFVAFRLVEGKVS